MTDRDIEKSTVKIQTPSGWGTGFVVGPGLVVTCAHVTVGAASIRIEGRDGAICTLVHEDISQRSRDALFPDVALIEVTDLNLPPLEIGEDPASGHPLYAWGFPQETHGSSMNGVCEGGHAFGPLDGQRLIKFRDTQIKPGFSGAPVLNLGTGRVCGMLKRTRDETSDAGGYAVRAAALLAVPRIAAAQRTVETALRSCLRSYLERLAGDCARLPRYFPERLRGFDQVRQRVRTIVDRAAFDRQAEERERRRAAGKSDDRYAPFRSRPEYGPSGEQGASPESNEPKTQLLDWEKIRKEARFRKIVVLGDPGFGKSWLLRYEARRRAIEILDELRQRHPDEFQVPILIKAQDLARFGSHTASLRQAFDMTLENEGMDSYFRAYILQRFEAGKIDLFVDAWDEVAEELRPACQKLLYAWSGSYQGSAILTSRPARFEVSPLGDAPLIELIAFEHGEIRAFVRSWFREDRAASFLEELEKQPAVKGLARIPLLLSLLCRTFEEDPNGFPEQRSELYQKVLRGLLKTWRREDKGAEVGDLDVEQMLNHASDAAFAVFPLSQFKENEFGRHIGEEAPRLVRTFLRDGILIRAGADADAPLAFLHRTFHEYLAARHASSRPWNEEQIHAWSWDRSWQPVLVMMAGQMRDSQRLIETLADRSKDDFFRPRLRLAAACLEEISIRDQALLDQLTAEALRMWLVFRRNEVAHCLIQWSAVIDGLARIGGRYHGKQLATAIARIRDPHLFLNGVTALSSPTPEIVSRLVECLGVSKSDVRHSAALALGEMGEKAATAEVVDKLVESLRDSWEFVRRSAAAALGQMGEKAATAEVVAHLLESLGDSEGFARHSAALGQMGERAAAAEVVERLVECLPDLGFTAAEALGRIGEKGATVEVLERLVEFLSNSDRSVGRSAASALAWMGEKAATDEVLGRLVELLSDSEGFVRNAAADALGRMGEKAATAVVLDKLVEFLSDTTSEFGSLNAALALGHMGEKATAKVVERLLECLRDPNARVRASAATALGVVGERAATDEVVSRLVELLSDSDRFVRTRAVTALGRMGEKATTAEAVKRLIEFLADPDLSSDAVQALGRMGERVATEEVLKRLVGFLRSRHLQNHAARALGRMGDKATTTEVVSRLVECLRNSDVRSNAAAALGELQLSCPKMRIRLLLSGSARLRYRLWFLAGSVRIALCLRG